MFRTGLQLLILLFLLAGCSGQPDKAGSEDPSARLAPFDQVYERFRKQNLEGVRSDLIALRPQVKDPVTQTYWHLLNAWYSLLGQDADRSLLWLSKSNAASYRSLKLKEFWRPNLIKAEALALKNEFLDSAKIRMYLTNSFRDDELEQRNQDTLWMLLLALPEDELVQLTQKPLPSLLKGWYQLAAMQKNPNTTLSGQRSSLRRWLNLYPDHPAAKRLPTHLQRLMALETDLPANIAVLLPTTGPLATTAASIRNGILYAYYQNASMDNPPHIRFYDTHNASLVQVYKQALVDGANLIIGPLQKDNVQNMQTAEKLPIPTLALNYGERDKSDNPENLFQFGIAAEDEARAVAVKAWQDGHRVAGALMPEGAWGERVFAAFAVQWHQLGGIIAESQVYAQPNQLNQKIQQLLNIADSEWRSKRIRNITGERLAFTPYRRQDLDFIFTASVPQDAKQIKPLLAYHFASSLPIYATSIVNDVSHRSSAGRDLENVVFCDIPWVVHEPKEVQQIQNTWNNANRGYLRLYAMGYDAFKAGTQISYLRTVQNARIFGSTGALQLDRFGQIQRLPEFATFKSGSILPLQAPTYELFNQDQSTAFRAIRGTSRQKASRSAGSELPRR